MKKLKINELEVGKIYRAFYRGEKTSGIYKIESNGKLFENYGLAWEESQIIYNEMFNVTFEEIKREIDWTKVPRGTKVQVRDNERGSWRNAYFSKFIKENEEYSFRASFVNDDKFTNIKMDDNEWGYKYCRIHESVEIPDEWYKEVE